MRRAVVGIMVAVVLWGPRAAGGGVRDLADAWLVPHTDAAALVGGENRARGWTARLSQGRLFGLEDLPQTRVAVTRRGRRITGGLAWERLGGDLYREDTWCGEILVGGRTRVGLRLARARLRLGGAVGAAHQAIDLRGQIPLGARLELSAWWPLRRAPAWYGRGGLRRWLRFAGRHRDVAWTLAIDRTASGTPVFGGEILARLAPAAALGLRCEPWSGSAGLCSAWRVGRVILRTSHLTHPELGVSHRWSVGIGGVS